MHQAAPDEQLAAELLESLAATADAAGSVRLFGELAGRLGLPSVIYGYAPAAQTRDGSWTVPAILTHNVPADWDANLDGLRWADPYYHACFRPTLAVDWQVVQADDALLPESRRFLHGVTNYDMTHGLTIPMRLPHGAISFLSYLGSARDAAFGGMLHGRRPLLFLLAYNLLCTMQARFLPALGGHAVPLLGRREQECLRWSALGKSAPETGTILGISAETVRIHLKRAYAKLGASNRCAAIANAIRSGALDLS